MWMGKRKAKGGISGWKKRFVVLDCDTISYFKAPGDELLGKWEVILAVAKLDDKKKVVLLDTIEGSYQLLPDDGELPFFGLGACVFGTELAFFLGIGTASEWAEALAEARMALFGGKKPSDNKQTNASHAHSTLGASYVVRRLFVLCCLFRVVELLHVLF
jgi:hypothetical protein